MVLYYNARSMYKSYTVAGGVCQQTPPGHHLLQQCTGKEQPHIIWRSVWSILPAQPLPSSSECCCPSTTRLGGRGHPNTSIGKPLFEEAWGAEDGLAVGAGIQVCRQAHGRQDAVYVTVCCHGPSVIGDSHRHLAATQCQHTCPVPRLSGLF